MSDLDVRIRDAFTTQQKIDKLDVKILEALSLLGPRNLVLVAKHLNVPTTTVRYRVRRMLSSSILFLHMNVYHTNIGLKKAVVFVEAEPGFEDILVECLKVNDFWIYCYRLFGPYEGCGGVWTVPKKKASHFMHFLESLIKYGVARSYEINWSTCFENIPVQTRWFNHDKLNWSFNWDEWIDEVKTIEGELPYTLVEPDDWPIRADFEDLLIIKELEIDGRKSLTDISKKLGINLETIKYHFREHVSKRGLVEGYQVEIYRFPFLSSDVMTFKFEFDSYEKFRKFALSIHDKPFPISMGKVLGEDALLANIYLTKWEFRRFIKALSQLIREGYLKEYHYVIHDMFQNWRETIPYEHFKDDMWDYDEAAMKVNLEAILEKYGVKNS